MRSQQLLAFLCPRSVAGHPEQQADPVRSNAAKFTWQLLTLVVSCLRQLDSSYFAGHDEEYKGDCLVSIAPMVLVWPLDKPPRCLASRKT